MGYNRPSCYALTICFTTSNPLDGATIFWGAFNTAVTSSVGVSKILIPRKGFIRACVVHTYSATVNGTNEDWPLSIRLNNTTDYPVATVGLSATSRTFENYNLMIPVGQGEYIDMKFVNPTWVTNPEGVRGWGYLLIECE